MTNDSTKLPVSQSEAETDTRLLDDWFDPIEAALRDQVRSFIQAMIEAELEAVLARPRYGRRPKTASDNTVGPEKITGHRHGRRSRSLIGTFGRVEIAVPRARLDTAEGKTTEWKSTALRAYQRRTKRADSLIAGAYLAGTNSRTVNSAYRALDNYAAVRLRRWSSRASGARRRVWRRDQQGHGQPGVAEGESRLGRLECPLARRGTDHPPDPGRHRGAGSG